MTQDNDLISQLTTLLQFDPIKEPGITPDAFSEVLAEIARDRQEKAKAKAREVITKAVELRKQMANARREFEKQEREFNKELGKLLNHLQTAVNGRTEEATAAPPPEPDAT
jgi:hypothetical protein